MAAHITTVQNSRLKTMVVPREHGAWGMMLVPLATGVVVAARTGINGAALALFITAAMSLFWLRTPAESWLGTSAIKAQTPEERTFVLRIIAAIGSVAALSLAGLLWSSNAHALIVIGTVSALAFAAQAAVKQFGRQGRMPAQIIGAIGLTSTAAGAYCVATGRLDRTAIGLWMANWLFAGNQVHFVQLRIRSARAATLDEKLQRGLPFLLLQLPLAGTIVAAHRCDLLPAAAAIAFVPVLLRGTSWFLRPQPALDVHKLGWSELSQALLFGALLCAAFLF